MKYIRQQSLEAVHTHTHIYQLNRKIETICGKEYSLLIMSKQNSIF